MGQQPQVSFRMQSRTEGILFLSGDLVVDQWFSLRENLIEISAAITPQIKSIAFDFQNVKELDTFGSWRISQFIKWLDEKQIQSHIINADQNQKDSVDDIYNFSIPNHLEKGLEAPKVGFVTTIGDKTLTSLQQMYQMMAFMGYVFQSIAACFRRPSLFRHRSFIKYMDYTGVRALPIIGLVAILIGIVLVYQGVNQLERFGAEIFTVNLLAVSTLRELGILLTAIVVAGRSGSSFTAQIGFMKLNQEIDAMKVLGLEPIQILVVPRILALMIVLPLLTIYCNLIAIGAGAYMSLQLIDLSFSQFLNQLQSAVNTTTVWVGLIKAPVFAFVIGLIGCYEGLRVKGGSENVGRQTTQSVVKSIFMVIVLDAIFSVIFSLLKI